jgi:hypothetical protein
MDAETIKREALDAILDLALDSTVSDIKHNGDKWCVQFEGDYGQYCDSFKNQFEHDNSPRVIREKIKKHLLGQITQLRNKGGRQTTKKGFADDKAPNVAELFQEAVTQTTNVIGDVINQTLGMTSTSVRAAGEVAESISMGAAEVIRPEVRPASRKATQKATRAGTPKKAAAKTKSAAKSQGARGTKKVSGTKKVGAKKKSSRKE